MDIRKTITDKIINMLEAGTTATGPRWTGSSAAGIPTNARTGEQYHGINVLVLWAEMSEKSYAASKWLTYNQAAQLGAQVRKGEKSVMCVYYSKVSKSEESKSDDEQDSYFLAKPFWLFNVAQIDNLPADLTAGPTALESFDPHLAAEQLLSDTGAQISYGFDSAYYSPAQDKICLPARERFTSEPIFYATAVHELTHWTGHESRLNRQFGKRFGDDSYAFEELVAELGAAFTVGSLGLIDQTIDNHANYVQSWIKVLKGDKGAIFTAASAAAKASDFILSGAQVH
jgi:antirestriction protein ArdC